MNIRIPLSFQSRKRDTDRLLQFKNRSNLFLLEEADLFVK